MARILVVDDDTDVRALVVRRLQHAGHRVQGASGVTETLKLIDDKGAPDVIVLDVNMPQVDGLELLGMVRQHVGRADLPAVFLSGKMLPDDIAAGRALGATYLTKPFVANALLGAINAILHAEAEAHRQADSANVW
ncbi:MAG: response regulator [Gemmatimonadales bacterium]